MGLSFLGDYDANISALKKDQKYITDRVEEELLMNNV